MSEGLLVSSKAQFDRYEAHVHDYVAQNYPGMDLEFQAVVSKLNQLKGVLTTDCCASHPDRNPGVPDSLYVAVLVTDVGLKAFTQVFERFAMTVDQDDLVGKYRAQSQFRCRRRMISPRIREQAWVWNIGTIVRTPEEKLRMLGILEGAVNHVLNDSGAGPL